MSRTLQRLARTGAVLLALAMSAAILWWAADLLDLPFYDGYDISLLRQPIAVGKLLGLFVALLLAVAVGTLIAGRVRYDAGWTCATVGLAFVSIRGGTVGDTLRAATGPAVFWTLALELFLLGLMLGVIWLGVLRLRDRGLLDRLLRRRPMRRRLVDRLNVDPEPLDQRLLALAMTTGLIAFGVMLLARTQDKAQVLAAVGISSFLSAWCGHRFVPTRPVAWFAAAPILAGLIGYVFAAIGTPEEWAKIGMVGGYFASLARPMPLDWASLGVAGAAWGYAKGRHAQREQFLAALESKTEPAPAGSEASREKGLPA